MILIALGSNLPGCFGTPEDNLAQARVRLEALGIKIVSMSRIWRSAPVPASDQPWYCNAVMAVETTLAPRAFLILLKRVEAEFGRIEDVRNAARVLDLDIIAYNDRVIEEDGLSIPHPRMEGRGFVLMPLQEVAPDWIHPVSGAPVSVLMNALPAGQGIEVQDDP